MRLERDGRTVFEVCPLSDLALMADGVGDIASASSGSGVSGEAPPFNPLPPIEIARSRKRRRDEEGEEAQLHPPQQGRDKVEDGSVDEGGVLSRPSSDPFATSAASASDVPAQPSFNRAAFARHVYSILTGAEEEGLAGSAEPGGWYDASLVAARLRTLFGVGNLPPNLESESEVSKLPWVQISDSNTPGKHPRVRIKPGEGASAAAAVRASERPGAFNLSVVSFHTFSVLSGADRVIRPLTPEGWYDGARLCQRLHDLCGEAHWPLKRGPPLSSAMSQLPWVECAPAGTVDPHHHCYRIQPRARVNVDGAASPLAAGASEQEAAASNSSSSSSSGGASSSAGTDKCLRGRGAPCKHP